MGTPMILRTAFVTALLMAPGGVLSACGFSNTFNARFANPRYGLRQQNAKPTQLDPG